MVTKLEIFIISDQPVTCPYCGRRTNWLADFSHTNSKTSIHECINHEPEYLFIMEDEEMFGKD
ncbi:MAG: hypothetical protein ABJB05_07560 [Parafilimonas sp.]